MPHDLAKTILENIGDGILSVDASLRVVFANGMACSILQRDKPEGMHLDDVISLVEYDESCSPKAIDPFREVLASGVQKSYSNPMVVSSVKERLIYVEDTVSPIKNSDGEIIGAVMVFRDVSEEMQMITLLKLASERYRMLFDSIRSGVAVYESMNGETFKIVDFNHAAQKIEGVNKADVLGKMVTEAFHGCEDAGMIAAFKKVWHTGQPERMPCSWYKDEVRSGWRDNYVYKLPSGEIVVIYDDVTVKKASADKIMSSFEKLRDSEERYRGMFENSSVGVVFEGSGPEYAIRQTNKSFCEMVGYTKDELAGKSVKDLIHPDDWDLSMASSDKGMNLPPGGQPVKVTKRYVRKNGEIRWGTAFISQIEREDKITEHFVQVVDITDRKIAEEAVEEGKRALERANGILAVECDVAKGIATGVAGGFNSIMSMAVSKLKVRWMCVALVGEDGIAGKWTEENGSSVNSIDEETKFTSDDAASIRKWVSESQIYIGDHGNLPQCLSKIAKKEGGHWMAIPVTNDKSHASVGVMMMASKNGRKWSKDECDAMNGLATMFCILARGEKNRADLERKIGETILSIGNVFVEARNGGGT